MSRSSRSSPSSSTSSIRSARVRGLGGHHAVALDLGPVADAPQQAVGDARRAAAALGDRQRAGVVEATPRIPAERRTIVARSSGP